MSPGSNPKLVAKIKQAIRSSPHQRISFDAFMAIALYEPELGYYTTSHRQLGPMGDFVTSSHLTHDYGELIGVQILECWEVLERPQNFTVVEVGAGQGLVSADALSYLSREARACLPSLRWVIVETAPSLVRWQQQYLSQRFAAIPDVSIDWMSLEELKSRPPIQGCFFSNELVDAFPVHLLQYQDGQFQEVYITTDPNAQLIETLQPLGPDLSQYVVDYMAPSAGSDALSSPYPDGYRCEINLAAQNWIADIAQCIHTGYVLTVDYGYPSQQLYSPARQGGTLQCYTQQKSHTNPLINIGNQDITSHVNFTALQQDGAKHQLTTLGFTQQGLFLMALGLGNRLTANNTNTDMTQVNQTLQQREALHALINPMGLGGFKVLLQGKGLTSAQQRYPYRGFQTT